MADVTGDLGGSPITLNNAATEATLKQLLAAIAILAAKTGKDIKNQQQLDAELKKFYGNLGKTGTTVTKLNKAQDAEAAKRRAIADAIANETAKRDLAAVRTEKSVAGIRNFTSAVENTVTKMTGMVSSLANMSNGFTGAAAAFSSLPLVGGLLGTVFGAIAQSGDKVYNSFREAASVGANFNGSIRDMVNGASGAGLTMDQFAGIIKRNGESVALLGTGSQDGAKQLAKLGKMMKDSAVGDDLARLGLNTEQINEGMAKFGGMMVRTGKQMDQKDLVRLSGEYMKNLAAVSELTGKNKDALQAEADARMADAQYRLMLAKLDPEGAKNLELMMSTIPTEHQAGLKEILATGTAVSDEAVAAMAFMNKTGQSAQALGQSMRTTGTLTLDQAKQFDKTRNAEAKMMAEQAKTGQGAMHVVGMFGSAVEQKLTVGVLNAAARTKTLDDALSDQAKSLEENRKKQADAMDPAAMKKFQEDIAKVSNTFTMLLAEQMPMLQSAFGHLSSVVTEYLLPAFNFLMDNFGLVVGGLIAFKAILIAVGLALKAQSLYKALAGPGTSAMKPMFVKDVAGGIGGSDKEGKDEKKDPKKKPKASGKLGGIGNIVKGAGAVGAIVSAGMLVSDLSDISQRQKDGDITAAEAKTERGGAVGGAVGGGGGAFAGAAAGAALGSVVPVIGTVVGGIVGGLLGGYLGRKGGQAAGESLTSPEKTETYMVNGKPVTKEEYEAQRKGMANDPRLKLGGLNTDDKKDTAQPVKATGKPETYMVNGKPVTKEEYEAQRKGMANDPRLKLGGLNTDDKKDTAQTVKAEDKKETAAPQTVKAEDKAAAKSLDLSSPEASARSFFAQQKSSLIQAEATKKELEAKGLAKTAEEEKAKKEAEEKLRVQKTINAEVESGPGATKAASPELAEISKSMAELVKINIANSRIMEKQLGVQESFSGDIWANPSA